MYMYSELSNFVSNANTLLLNKKKRVLSLTLFIFL